MNNKAYIYKITNKKNGKSYIGITRDRSVFARWSEHLNANHELSKDVELYGMTAFIFEVLEEIEHISDHDLFRKESHYINKFNTIDNGYNLILSNRKERRPAQDYSKRAREGLESFATTDYFGKPTQNSNSKNSFWRKLGDQMTCFISLLMESNYLTRDNSKYEKILKAVYYGRDQRFIKIEYGGQEYVTDNINDIIDLMGLTREDNRHLPYKLVAYYIDNDFIEMIIDYEGVHRRLKVYSPMLYEDETRYYFLINNLLDIFED